MAKRLTPEEKLQREVEKKAKREADRLAAQDARRQQWEAEKLAAKQAFEAGLTDHQRAAIAKILVSNGTKVNEYDGLTVPTYESPFIEDLTRQLNTRGYLSAGQLNCVVKNYDKFLNDEKVRETIQPIEIGTVYETLARFDNVQLAMVRNFNGYGQHEEATIRWTGKDGRKFKFSTSSRHSIDSLQAAREANEPVMLKAKVKWIAPNGIITVLGGAGSQVRRLLE